MLCYIVAVVSVTLLSCSSKLLLYIVVSQDVVTAAVVLEMQACVGRDQHIYFACFGANTLAWSSMTRGAYGSPMQASVHVQVLIESTMIQQLHEDRSSSVTLSTTMIMCHIIIVSLIRCISISYTQHIIYTWVNLCAFYSFFH